MSTAEEHCLIERIKNDLPSETHEASLHDVGGMPQKIAETGHIRSQNLQYPFSQWTAELLTFTL